MTASASPTLLSFSITPISNAFVARVRATLRDDFGRTVAVTTAAGGEPMRDQLRRAAPGERLILCSFQAVPLPSPFAEIGPVFVSADAPTLAPFRDSLPPGYFNRTFALRAYDRLDRIIDSTLVEPAEAAGAFAKFLARAEVTFLHARFAGHGCFAARIERSAPEVTG